MCTPVCRRAVQQYLIASILCVLRSNVYNCYWNCYLWMNIIRRSSLIVWFAGGRCKNSPACAGQSKCCRLCKASRHNSITIFISKPFYIQQKQCAQQITHPRYARPRFPTDAFTCNGALASLNHKHITLWCMAKCLRMWLLIGRWNAPSPASGNPILQAGHPPPCPRMKRSSSPCFHHYHWTWNTTP